MAYTDKGKIQNYLNIDIASSFDTQIDTWIEAVTAWIDRYCGKSFEAAASGARYYDTDGSDTIFIDDFVGSATVEVLDSDGDVTATLTEGAGEDYLLYPLNQTTKNEIRLIHGGQYASFPRGSRLLKVTATFGHAGTPPADVQLAATKLVASIVDKGLKGGKLSSVSLGDYSANFQAIDESAEAMGITNILDHYRDIKL